MAKKLQKGEITGFDYASLPSQLSVIIRSDFPDEITVHSTLFQHFIFNCQYLIEKGYSFSLDGVQYPVGTIGSYKATMVKKNNTVANKRASKDDV